MKWIYVCIYMYTYKNRNFFCEYLNMACNYAFVKVKLNMQLAQFRSLYPPSWHFWTPLLNKGSNLALHYIYCLFGYRFSNWESYRSEQTYGEKTFLQQLSKIAGLWPLEWWPFKKYGRVANVTGSSNTKHNYKNGKVSKL